MIFFFRIINNGYSSLPRSSSAQSGFLTPNHHLNYAGSSVARSRSSASLASEATTTPKRPPSVASLASSSGTNLSRTKNSRPKPKTVNASLSIWQIQKELKRGEMVQVKKNFNVPCMKPIMLRHVFMTSFRT